MKCKCGNEIKNVPDFLQDIVKQCGDCTRKLEADPAKVRTASKALYKRTVPTYRDRQEVWR